MKKGTLYLIPCPIADTDIDKSLPAGNLGVMRTLDYFIVENLRSARRFLSRAAIGKPIDSLSFGELNEHTTEQEIPALIKPLLEGRDAGLVSEAGLPGIADPGADVVALCHQKGIRVVPLSGPSSIFMALMASGLNGQSFAFNGYLPIKQPDRGRAIRMFEKRASDENQSQIFIETPYRNVRLFEELLSACRPSTRLSVAVDLMGPEELIRTLTVGDWKKTEKPDINKRPAIFILL